MTLSGWAAKQRNCLSAQASRRVVMSRPMTANTLRQENLAFAGTNAVSGNNRTQRFLPAFRDDATGRVELARFANGKPAPAHLIVGLPSEWAIPRSGARDCPPSGLPPTRRTVRSWPSKPRSLLALSATISSSRAKKPPLRRSSLAACVAANCYSACLTTPASSSC